MGNTLVKNGSYNNVHINFHEYYTEDDDIKKIPVIICEKKYFVIFASSFGLQVRNS